MIFELVAIAAAQNATNITTPLLPDALICKQAMFHRQLDAEQRTKISVGSAKDCNVASELLKTRGSDSKSARFRALNKNIAISVTIRNTLLCSSLV